MIEVHERVRDSRAFRVDIDIDVHLQVRCMIEVVLRWCGVR